MTEDDAGAGEVSKDGKAADQPRRQVLLQKIYLRDASVEVPDGPQIFTREWKPDVDVDLNTRVRDFGTDTHQVSVKVTVTAKVEDTVAYIVEVEHAGVFLISGFENDEDRAKILGSYCPNNLFPYVREIVGDLVQRAGFPHFLLQPVNFDALYQRHLDERQQQASATH